MLSQVVERCSVERDGDPSLTIAQRCRAEKVLRDLDPDDVLELDRVARVAGGIQRLSEGRGIFHFAEDRHRWAVVEQSPSVDALLSSECVRYVDGMWGGPVAVVTSRGRVLLHLLRSYIAPRRRPASGREIVPGERGEHAARESLTVDFQSAMIKAAALARATRFDLTKSIHLRDYRVQFDYSKPGLDQKNKEPQPITEPPHDKSTRLHLWPLLQEIIETLKSTAPAAIEVVELQGQGFGSVQINGPFDVMRWLAEDVDAWWT